MESARLERIGAALRAEIDAGALPGAVVAIARHGTLVYHEAFGYIDADARAPMPHDAIFTIASMTKPMTSVAALALAETGRLLINAPVDTYLPQLAGRRVQAGATSEAAWRAPTVHDLLRHTAGWTYGTRGDGALAQAYAAIVPGPVPAAEFLAALGALPLHFQPGTRWDYSLATDVLGVVVEAVAGERLGAVLARLVFEPLGMSDTAFEVPPAQMRRFARAVARDPQSGEPPDTVHDLTRPAMDSGGGGAFSTALDYLRFAEMLRRGGTLDGVRILGRKTVEYMLADQLGPEVDIAALRAYPNINGYGFGLGVAVRRAAGVAGILGSPGDFNWGGKNGTYFWVDPAEELSVVFMAHTPGPLRVRLRQLITTLVLQAVD